jgi:hypothetical protein
MLIGTRLMLSSLRVAVTVISSSEGPTVSVSPASAATAKGAAYALIATKIVRKSNGRQKTR